MTAHIQVATSFSASRKAGAYAFYLTTPQGSIKLCGPLRQVDSESQVLAHALGFGLSRLASRSFTSLTRIRVSPGIAVRKVLECSGEQRSAEEVYCAIMLKKVKERYTNAVLDFWEDPQGYPWGTGKVKEIISGIKKFK